MIRRRISWLVSALAVSGLAFGVGASAVSADEGIDPKKAKDLIPIVLVVDDSVLDGDGWTVVRDDYTPTAAPKTAACDNSRGKLTALEKSIEGQLAAKGKVTATQNPEAGQAPVFVETEISVYNSAPPLAAVFKELKAVYRGSDLAACLVSSIESNLSGATGTTVQPFLPDANDNPGGAAYAVEVVASQLIDPVRVEHYSFTLGNTLVMMTFIGPKPVITSENVASLLQLQAQALKVVAGY